METVERRALAVRVAIGMTTLGALVIASRYDYLLFHIMAETLTIVVSFGVFMIAYHAREMVDQGYLKFLGVAYLFIGSVDLLHMLAYRGMGVFHATGANLATQLWIVARYEQSLAMLVAPFVLDRVFRRRDTIIAFGVITVAALAAVFAGVLPAAFVEGVGLTPFKIASEWIIITVLAASLWALARRKSSFDPAVYRLISAFVWVSMFSEVAFTLYADPYGLMNLVGHLLRIVAVYLLFRAVILTALLRPSDVLFRRLRDGAEALRRSEEAFRGTFDNAAVGMAHLSPENVVLRANARLAEILGVEIGSLQDASLGALTHPEDVAADRESFRRLLAGEADEHMLEKRFVRPDGSIAWTAVSRSIALDASGRPEYLIGVVEDLTERHLAEELLRRDKELSDGLAAIDTAITGTRDVDVILSRVVAAVANALDAEAAAVGLVEVAEVVFAYAHGMPDGILDTRVPLESFDMVLGPDKPVAPLVVDDVSACRELGQRMVDRLGGGSAMFVPLRTSSTNVGLLSVHRFADPRPFSEEELDFASRLGATLSLTVENARLYEREHSIAETLQSGILHVPERLARVTLGHASRSATELARIGGDFYDVFEISEGLLGILLGDVSGKGVEAATLTSMARTTIRTFAYQETGPAAVLSAANRVLVRLLSDSRFVTAIFGVLDLGTGELRLSSAGHPEPFRIGPGRLIRERMPKNTPLGLFPRMEYAECVVVLEPTDKLVLFTDGLLDARDGLAFFGEARTHDVLQEHALAEPQAVVDALIDAAVAFSHGRQTDDIAVVALRWDPES